MQYYFHHSSFYLYSDDNDDDDDEYGNFYSAITQHMPLQGRLHKKLVACQRYDFSYCVFSLDLNASYGGWDVIPAPRSGNRKSVIAETGLRFSDFKVALHLRSQTCSRSRCRHPNAV